MEKMKYLSTIVCFIVCFAFDKQIFAYKYVRLQDNLCSNKVNDYVKKFFTGTPTLSLTEESDSAAIISQTWNLTLPGQYSSNKIKYDCKFKVQTSEKKPKGIYTIITLLKFRRDPVTDKCIDYIQFKRGNRSPSERICNDISIDGPGGRLIFDERDRDVSVHVHIEEHSSIFKPLELLMVLTAHSTCKYTGDFLCEPNDEYSCISRHFVRDNITNCMHPCRDEISCFHDVITPAEIDTTSVALSTITSFIFTMLGVGFCVWICWKYWNCITVQQRAHEASAIAHRQNAREPITVELPSAPTDDIIMPSIATVHQYQEEQLQHAQDPKDLPPTYESLFPERSKVIDNHSN